MSIRAFALSAPIAALLALLPAAPSTASLKGSCIIEGEAKLVDKEDPQMGVRLVGGRGKFAFFDIDALCRADTNKDGITEAPVTLGIGTTGWYQNFMCGTAKALGTVDKVEGGTPKWQLLVGKKFGIEIVAGVGTVKWHDWDKPDLDVKPLGDPMADADKSNEAGEKSYSTAGVVDVAPATSKPGDPVDLLAGECTKGLHITGSVMFHFS